MRKSRAETARTRQHIVSTASREFRRKGVDGVSLSEVMKKAGLTHGGFYRHFRTKDALVVEALGSTFEASVEKMTATADDLGIESLISDYLSERHRDNRADGCAFASLGGELARCERDVRDKATSGFLRQAEIIARKLKGLSPEEARKRGLVILAAIAGAVNMSRVVTDPVLSQVILQETARNIRFLATQPAIPSPVRPSKKGKK